MRQKKIKKKNIGSAKFFVLLRENKEKQGNSEKMGNCMNFIQLLSKESILVTGWVFITEVLSTVHLL